MKVMIPCVWLVVFLLEFPAFSQQVISLKFPAGQPFMMYKNNGALIRFSYKDLVDELMRIREGDGFLSLKESEKERIITLTEELKTRQREWSKTSAILYLFSDQVEPQDELLLVMLEQVLGAGLLARGKAAVWQRVPLKEVQHIRMDNQPGPEYRFYFIGSDSSFFHGRVIQKSASRDDLERLKSWFHRTDSVTRIVLANQGNKPGTFTEPRYPGGIEKFSEYLQKNVDCRSSARKGEIYYLEFTVGSDGIIVPASIAVTNAGEDFGEECFMQLKKVVTESERWIPAYAGKNIPFKLTLEIVFR